MFTTNDAKARTHARARMLFLRVYKQEALRILLLRNARTPKSSTKEENGLICAVAGLQMRMRCEVCAQIGDSNFYVKLDWITTIY